MDLITSHLNTDFDGFASMVAARKLYPGALLAFPGGAQEHVRHFLALHDVGVSKLKQIQLSSINRLVLVDTQDPERIGPFKELWYNPSVRIHIYDHHPQGPTAPSTLSPRIEQCVIDSVGASATILAEQLQKARQTLTPFEATILAIGLYEETGSLAYPSTTARDLEAAAWLRRLGADLTKVTEILRNHLTPPLVTLLHDLLQTSETFYINGRKILVAASSYDQYKGDLAEVVEKLTDLEGYDAVVAALSLDDKVQLIGRCRQPDFNMRELMQEFGGGGHHAAASATIKGSTLSEVKERLVTLLTHQHRPQLRAQQVMTTPVKSIKLNSTVAEAEAQMTKYGVNVLPVLDGRNRYVGLITRETIQKSLFHRFHHASVSSILETGAYTATPDTPFHEIEQAMIERNQRFVPILKGLTVVGVITRTDLLRTMHHDLLAKGLVPVKGEEGPLPKTHRNVKGLLKSHLPPEILEFLIIAGSIAQHHGCLVYAVGGFVRDLLLDRTNLDVDLVVEGDGLAFARSFAQRIQGRAKTHARFGTARIITPTGFKLDVATARTEYYEYPTALPTVEQSSIKKDLYRRDFTINALAICLSPHRFGELIDFYGGQRDLQEKAIRVLHSLSFVEDPTRVFRAIRFEQRYEFRLGKETLTLIKGAIKMDLFHRLSSSRLFNELVLILSEERPIPAIARLAELDVLRFIHPALKWSPKLRGLLEASKEVLQWYKLSYLNRDLQSWVVYFMALMDVLPRKTADQVMHALRVPAREIGKIRQSHGLPQALRRLSQQPDLRPSEIYSLLEGFSDESLLHMMAKAKSDEGKRHISAFLSSYQSTKPSLTGHDLQVLGLHPGPAFKRILDRLRSAKLNGEIKTDAEEREAVRQWVQHNTV